MNVVCPSCGQENPEGFRLCGMCGTALVAETAPAREERKVVTVLFCDLVGSTARAEGADPEDVRALLSAYHERVRHELERFGGTVEKFIGDAVVAVFGAPVVHEDDAERAVRAASAIRDWAREDGEVEVRIAVNTGEALVSVDARAEAGEAMVAGDVVNTAARLQGASPVNGILVGERTFYATERAIEYRPAEPVRAKGKAEPVPCWEALQARSLLGVDVDLRPARRLIGRQRELDQLWDALARARTVQESQLVTVIGVPGMGKSRLVQELSARVEAQPDLIRWRQGRSLPYGQGISFWALGEMVKAEAGILETDSTAVARTKLAAVVGRVCDSGETEWVEGELAPLVGLGDESASNPGRRDDAFAAWRRLLEGMAEERPSILVFEDLHWADDGLLDFVDALADWATDVPLLVVCTARPELLTRRPGWGGGKPNAATLSLTPLSEQETAELVHSILERAVLPADVQAAVLTRAGGNPLYAEEFARMVVERGPDPTDELPVPDSLQAVIAARLDALGREEKQLLQDAAVVGKVFWPGAIVPEGTPGATDGALRALERKEFVRRERRSAVEGEQQYAFRHVLVRDVAYGQMPRADRAAKHEQVASWLESLPRSEDVAELLAHHYLSAIEYSRAAGLHVDPLAARARVALREAGRRAVGLNSFGTAFRFYEAAAELTPEDDPDWPLLALEHALAGRFVDLSNDRLLLRARDRLLEGEAGTGARAEMLLGEYCWLRGERSRADEHFHRAESLLADVPESEAKAEVLASLSRFAMLADEQERAIALGKEALARAEAFGLDVLRANALNNVGVARVHLGDKGGLDDLETSREIARGVSAPEYVRACGNLASVLVELGALSRAGELREEGLRFSKEVGLAEPIRWFSTELTVDALMQGRWDEARRLVDPLIAEFDRSPFWIEPMARVCRARMLLGEGDVGQARADAARALERAREVGDFQMLVTPICFSARLHAELGDLAKAEKLVDEVLGRWRETGFSGTADEWVVELWLPALRTGREKQFGAAISAAVPNPWLRAGAALVERDFAGAASTLSGIGAATAEALVRLWAAAAFVEEGRRGDADAELGRSVDFWRSVGATRYIREGEALLAESA
jgi:class 3 adenylate cyclase/tetratricopeptide (TPR) repeat protein